MACSALRAFDGPIGALDELDFVLGPVLVRIVPCRRVNPSHDFECDDTGRQPETRPLELLERVHDIFERNPVHD